MVGVVYGLTTCALGSEVAFFCVAPLDEMARLALVGAAGAQSGAHM